MSEEETHADMFYTGSVDGGGRLASVTPGLSAADGLQLPGAGPAPSPRISATSPPARLHAPTETPPARRGARI